MRRLLTSIDGGADCKTGPNTVRGSRTSSRWRRVLYAALGLTLLMTMGWAVGAELRGRAVLRATADRIPAGEPARLGVVQSREVTALPAIHAVESSSPALAHSKKQRLGPGSAPPPVYHPRDPNEWQGMLVDVSALPIFCRTPSDCGAALGCFGKNGCGPCAVDRDCGSGEACVLDRCVLNYNVWCRSYRDCSGGVKCMLTGLSDDPRGNAEMQAVCADQLRLVLDENKQEVVPEPPGIQMPPTVTYEALLRSIQKERVR